MATTTNFGWTTPDDTSLVKDGAAAIRSLGQAIDTSLMDLEGGTTGQTLTKNSNTDMDFVWATAAAGGMTSIASGTLSGASVSLTSIAGTYKDLVLVLRDFYGSAEDSMKFRYNNDSTANRYIQAPTSASNVAFDDDAHRFTTAAIDNSTSNGISIVEIYDYANTTHWKSHRVLTYTNHATTTTNYNSFISAGLYNQDTAITRIDMFPTGGTFTAGTYTLYGVN
jgi:hypothetical protein